MPTLYRFTHARKDGDDWLELREAISRRGAVPIPPVVPAAKKTETNRKAEDMSRETIVAQAKMFELLKEHFTGDGKLGAYDEGWSDARVASESGLSERAVAEAREAVHGRIDDPELTAVEAEYRALSERVVREVGEMRQLLENLQTESARRLDDFAERVRLLREKRR